MNIKKVGLLFDSVSNNTGDNAVGIVLKKFLDRQGIDSETVDPFDFNSEDYLILIIGGGLLIRDRGDWFYDVFRVKGRHILNTVGIMTTDDLDYLNEYAMVTVRSETEKKSIADLVQDVKTAPCVAVMMEGKSVGVPPIQKGSVGIHFAASSLIQCPDLATSIDEAIIEHKILLPITYYAKDMSLLSKFRWSGTYETFPEMDPEQVFWAIGKLKFLITSSLHAAIFAYIQNVPFLVLESKKIRDFFSDRGLEAYLFKDGEDLKKKVLLIRKCKTDFSRSIEIDKKKAIQHLQDIEKILRKSISDSEKLNDFSEEKSLNTRLLCNQEKKKDLEIMHLKNIIDQRDVIISKSFEKIKNLEDSKNFFCFDFIIHFVESLKFHTFFSKIKFMIIQPDKFIVKYYKRILRRNNVIENGKENIEEKKIEITSSQPVDRKFPESKLAHELLDGLKGLEIGGSAHNSFGLKTRNVDYSNDMTTVFKRGEIEICGEAMPVDIVAPGDNIPIPDESEDFVISSHVIEHFPDPIKALKEWYRIVKPGGYVYIIAPHKERTFDKDRPRTTLQELIERHESGKVPAVDTHAHYSVWITQDFVDLINHLGWNIVAVQDVDDKVGNGFAVVIRK